MSKIITNFNKFNLNEDNIEDNIYDGYYTNNPFLTLSTFLNNELKVDLDYEIDDDMDAESYLDEEVEKILKLNISKNEKIKKIKKFIKNNFEINFPPYRWTSDKLEQLEEKLEDMFDW